MPPILIPSLTTVVLVSANAEWRIVREMFPDAVIQKSPYGEWFEQLVDTSLYRRGTEYPNLRPFWRERLLRDIKGRIIFLQGGWGKIAAAGSTQYAVQEWRPLLLINLGTCGGFQGRIERGTIVLVEKTIVYDIIEQMGDFDEAIDSYTTALDLSWLDGSPPLPVQRGLMISGDRDLVIADLPELVRRYGAVAGDWESGAIAYVAARNQVPCLILRGVTDLVGPDGGELYGNIKGFQEATRSVMERLLASLPDWIRAANLQSSLT